ncbi:FKBP-type peptidylprolyl isomerase [Flavobacterium sp. Sd200]|uniref:FKBP-type peptidyl-prolyl cis-trans isomerase n=1 Tax=Flavobacterium sp. Sd200 TaxID=2692211 RepID=UPI0014501E76|nr:FKBP-type peptidylprolyl isomerase [Flavobacterium sp. Sd200]MXN91751.1 FKBP-type peptidylprolyl isomerase [Flavobacterium sp. Sd200]
MNQFLKAFCLIGLITFFASCKKDDDVAITPPRDYAVQYASEKDSIEKYLKNHYMDVDPVTFDVTFDSIRSTGPQVSIWDQTEYPLRNKVVTLNEVEYTIYYLSFREGVGKAPTRGDNVLVNYKGTLLDDTQFELQPFPQTSSSLYGTIEGWQEIIPLFKDGVYVDEPNSPNPPQYQDYGAGVMFLPSDFAYYNTATGDIPAYSPLVFSFKLYSVTYTDLDEDGILNKDETEPGIDIADYDTDGDDIPNYLDSDDDGDGYTTKYELEKLNPNDPSSPGVPVPFVPAQYYSFDDAALLPCSSSGLKPYLDPTCHPSRP